ncbi:hypothetical protein SUGI_0098680 [Cryptomeria japonica]|nr:hypothetical protein SUGI_0098680 [Cryptomeria japonica]
MTKTLVATPMTGSSRSLPGVPSCPCNGGSSCNKVGGIADGLDGEEDDPKNVEDIWGHDWGHNAEDSEDDGAHLKRQGFGNDG